MNLAHSRKMTLVDYFSDPQTGREHRRDMRVMRKLKAKLAHVGDLLVEEAVEWSAAWRIPLVVSGPVCEDHFMLVRECGASLRLLENFESPAYIVVLGKTREPLRHLSTREKVVFIISTLGAIVCATLGVLHVKRAL